MRSRDQMKFEQKQIESSDRGQPVRELERVDSEDIESLRRHEFEHKVASQRQQGWKNEGTTWYGNDEQTTFSPKKILTMEKTLTIWIYFVIFYGLSSSVYEVKL